MQKFFKLYQNCSIALKTFLVHKIHIIRKLQDDIKKNLNNRFDSSLKEQDKVGIKCTYHHTLLISYMEKKSLYTYHHTLLISYMGKKRGTLRIRALSWIFLNIIVVDEKNSNNRDLFIMKNEDSSSTCKNKSNKTPHQNSGRWLNRFQSKTYLYI